MLIKKIDDELQVVYGEVYVPSIPDAHGDFMTEEEVRKMAHRFLASGRVNRIDIQHNNELTGAVVVESFIARKDDEVFIPLSWVVGVHIPSPELWQLVKDGEINGFSIEALVSSEDQVIELEVPESISGYTDVAEGHTHTFTIRFDENGNFLGGSTDTVDNHRHRIEKATTTQPGGEGRHAHRYSFLEVLANANRR